MTKNHPTLGSMRLLTLLMPILLLGLSGAIAGVRAAPTSEGPSLGVMVRGTPFSQLEELGLGHGVTVGAVVDHLAGRALDLIGVDAGTVKRWQGQQGNGTTDD